MRVASENRVPVAARAALTRAVTATDAQLSRTRTLERGEVVQTHALFRRIRRDGHRRRARRDGRPTRRDARAGHRRRSLEGHLRSRENTRTNARSSVIAHASERSHPSRNTVSTPSLVPTALARTSRVPLRAPPPRNPRSPPLPRRAVHRVDRGTRATAARDRERARRREIILRASRRDRARAPRSQRATSSSNPSARMDNDVPSRDRRRGRAVSTVLCREGGVVLRMGKYTSSIRVSCPVAVFFMIVTLPIIRSFDPFLSHI